MAATAISAAPRANRAAKPNTARRFHPANMQKLRSVSLTTAYVICRTQESKAAKSAAVKGVTNYRWLLQQGDLDAGQQRVALEDELAGVRTAAVRQGLPLGLNLVLAPHALPLGDAGARPVPADRDVTTLAPFA